MLLHLEHERRHVTYARRWVLRQAAEVGIQGEARAVVELLTSELVANALEHGPAGGIITVHTSDHDGLFHVTVSDAADALPVVGNPPPTAEGGRGMMLVDMLADSWGTQALQGGGKAVWFVTRIGEQRPEQVTPRSMAPASG
ncbi:ATP-binding protein [uncultured Cellulomonas sp.]|uniref:ATP-binding protein n=1 Tax=uncultured Cellulomonas sp. TaxID=189682 RepID=UPI0026398A5D|nr:ATP-binding protein [uncultured Cellulomonas sp.]